MSWRQEETHRGLMKKVGVQLKGEDNVRKFARNLLPGFVFVKKTTFDKNNTDVDAPLGYIRDLRRLVGTLLDQYKKQDMLTWHTNTIPINEIWIKIGGDHGKQSLKITLQIANVAKPNAKRNVVVTALAPVRNSHENLKQMFNEIGLCKEIEMLRDFTWEGKNIVVFLNEDYEFLTKVYGISGAAGTFPCLWCHMPRRQMHSDQPLYYSMERSLDGLEKDFNTFFNFNSDKKDTARFNNCLHSPIIQIPLDLHICTFF